MTKLCDFHGLVKINRINDNLNKNKKMTNKIREFIYGIWMLTTNIIMIIPFYCIRHLWLKIFLRSFGKGNAVKRGVEIRIPHRITIGNNNCINHHVLLDGRGDLVIGNNVDIAQEVNIWTAQHDYNDDNYSGTTGKVVIEDYVWLASRVTILPGVHIHKGAVVASGAIVTKDVPENAIVGGIPAKIIGYRKCNFNYKLGQRVWFE